MTKRKTTTESVADDAVLKIAAIVDETGKSEGATVELNASETSTLPAPEGVVAAQTIKKEFVIESNIPVPSKGGRGRKALYPWTTLNVGDSFAIPEKTAKSFGPTVARAQKENNIKLVVRNLPETEGVGVRVWRTE